MEFSSKWYHETNRRGLKVRVMVFDATFNNISAISWRSDLSVEETKVSGKKPLSHNVASSTPRLSGIRTHNVSGDRH